MGKLVGFWNVLSYSDLLSDYQHIFYRTAEWHTNICASSLTQYCTFCLSAKSWHIAFARFDHRHTILLLHHLYNVQVMQQQYCMSLQCTFEVLKVRLGLGIIVLTFFGQWGITYVLTLTPNFRAVCWRKSISQNHLGAPLHWSRKIIIQYSGKE